MSYDAHIASKYQVEYAPAFRFDEFIRLFNLFNDKVEELDLRDNPCYAWDDDDSWFEFDKKGLTDVLEKLDADDEDDQQLKPFIEMLLREGDPENEFVRIDVW
jgi:hypothetical protein